MRVFYAVTFADYIKQALVDSLPEIKKYTSRGSFTAKDNFHITLVFVGECDTGKLEPLKGVIDKTVKKLDLPELFRANPIKATIDKLGTFARPDDALMWAGVKTSPDDILSKIHKTINQELVNCGIYIKQDRNKFTPHITIARRVEFASISGNEIDQINFAPIDFTINSITLMESIMSVETNKTSGGRQYTKIVYKPLYERKF